MKFMISLLLIVAACTSEDIGSTEQAEMIEVHGCRPGYIEVEDEGGGWGCIDPWDDWWPRPDPDVGWEDERLGGPGGIDESGGSDTCPDVGGYADGCGADPYPIPAPKDCTQELTNETCYACCDWNVDKVWGERCRRMPDRTKEQRKEKALCWGDAENRRSACQRECPPITTVAP